MKKSFSTLYSILIIIALITSVFYFMMPQNYDVSEAPLSEFSTKRALEKVKEISLKPHYVTSQNHKSVADYLVKELQNLGLEASLQEGFTMTEKGTLIQSKNILARIKGTANTKSLLLLSHYDSAPHSYSFGASDDGAGVATILECVRAFLHNKKKHKNDIIILFSDAEEVGLNGAALFVTQHHWAKNVGLVLNFEARGSSGPSYMLMETNQGNSKMVDVFTQGNTNYPVSNSLMYSIYKMLPNDTDLTVFREIGKIQGFNFAFIDDHFDYHTAQDNYKNINRNSLAHQGTYLYPLLNYCSNADLKNLNSSNDKVYFSIPFSFLSYPFSWILPMLIVAIALFLVMVFIGMGKHVLRLDEIIKGFVPLFGSLIIAGGLTFFGWKLLLHFYPQYKDILHDFTYNGHDYIYAFVGLTLAICFLFYKNDGKRNPEMNQTVAPLFVWLIINSIIAFQLKGAGFFIIPVFATLLMLGLFILTQKSNQLINLILAIPSIVLFIPLIQMLPIGLGLSLLVGSSVLTVLCFGLLLPIFGSYPQKKLWSTFLFLVSVGLFVKAHQSSGYTNDKAKPNSLVYVLDGDTNKSNWATYDINLDVWTKTYLGLNPKEASSLNTDKLYSKYNSDYTFMAEAPLKPIAKPNIEFLKDTTYSGQRFLKIKITPNRKVNRYDVFASNNLKINNLKANGVQSIDIKSNIIRKKTNKIISYYVVDNIPLELSFSTKAGEKLDMNLVESSFDLMTNPLFKIRKRENWMIPKPFVLTDAVIIKQKLKPQLIVDSTTTKRLVLKSIKKRITPAIIVNNETSN